MVILTFPDVIISITFVHSFQFLHSVKSTVIKLLLFFITLIDLLVLDVEGAEIEVLEGIDHRMFKFKYMCIESRNAQRLFEYLNPLGYVLKEKLTEQDYLYSALK